MDRIQGHNFYSSMYFHLMELYRHKTQSEQKYINKLKLLHQTLTASLC